MICCCTLQSGGLGAVQVGLETLPVNLPVQLVVANTGMGRITKYHNPVVT